MRRPGRAVFWDRHAGAQRRRVVIRRRGPGAWRKAGVVGLLMRVGAAAGARCRTASHGSHGSYPVTNVDGVRRVVD